MNDKMRLRRPPKIVIPRQRAFGVDPDGATLPSGLAEPIVLPDHGASGLTLASAPAEPPVSGSWRHRIGRRLWLSDGLAVVIVTFGVQVAWLGPGLARTVSGGDNAATAPTYTMLSVVLALAWMVSLGLLGARSHRVLGSGTEEYRRVVAASLGVFGLLAVFAYSLQYEVARGYVGIVFPLGVAVLVTERWIWRQWLNAQRGTGQMSSPVLVVGTRGSAEPLAGHIDKFRSSGLQVRQTLATSEHGDPVAIATVVDDAVTTGVDAVVVTASARLDPVELRTLRWALEDNGVELIIAPALTGLSGRRVHTRPVEGLSLLHVDGARYDGSMRVVKGLVDRMLAATALVVLSPLLVATVIAVRLTSPGPAFYRQERVGRGGETFHIWKFRSMHVNADAELAALIEAQGTAGQPLFKVERDPRVTPLGSFLRQWSIDELPQLLNVVKGDMSLVGPRPQRPAEVALYDDAARRRLRAKPGLTGLWQVSGRSDVPWAEAVEMDLYYVENWSFGFDLLLLWRTVAAVLRGRGAY